jgi:hypothetical protein
MRKRVPASGVSELEAEAVARLKLFMVVAWLLLKLSMVTVHVDEFPGLMNPTNPDSSLAGQAASRQRPAGVVTFSEIAR